MEETRSNRTQRKKRKQRRVTGCFCIFALIVVLIAVFVVLRALDTPAFTGGTTTLRANPYGPEDFEYAGGWLTCTAGSSRRGVDVSEYQGEIDWDQVRGAGFDFAFIRIGYRGYSVGAIYHDDRARENLAGAKAAGLDVGVYFYAQAVSAEEAAEEARWCLEFLNGESLDLPVVYDWEYVDPSARTGNMDRQTLTACFQTFCDTMAEHGYQGMVYFNSHVATDLLDLESLAQYPWWLAMYDTDLDFPHQIDFWQYTESGQVPGIEGDVDIDLMFLYD